MMDNFFTQSPQWHLKIGEIHALLERVRISEEQHGDVLRLRKLNRILSIHASTAIEGNILTSRQVQDVVNGKPVLGPPKDIKEVRNAWTAYNLLEELNPYSSRDLLKAHASMTAGLVDESGAYRTCGVVVARGDGTILHQGAAYEDESGNLSFKVPPKTVSKNASAVPPASLPRRFCRGNKNATVREDSSAEPNASGRREDRRILRRRFAGATERP